MGIAVESGLFGQSGSVGKAGMATGPQPAAAPALHTARGGCCRLHPAAGAAQVPHPGSGAPPQWGDHHSDPPSIHCSAGPL